MAPYPLRPEMKFDEYDESDINVMMRSRLSSIKSMTGFTSISSSLEDESEVGDDGIFRHGGHCLISMFALGV